MRLEVCRGMRTIIGIRSANSDCFLTDLILRPLHPLKTPLSVLLLSANYHLLHPLLLLTACHPPVRSLPTPPPLVSRYTRHYNQTTLFTSPSPNYSASQLLTMCWWDSTWAAGPVGVSPRLLKALFPSAIWSFHHVFSMSLSLQRVPVKWKTSCAEDLSL